MILFMHTCTICYHNISCILYYRLISRAVLFHFKKVCPRSSDEQDAHDVELAKEMEKAHGAAGDIVSLGKTMRSCRQEFVTEILPQVQSALSDAIHRVQHSYGLTMFATLKVSIVIIIVLHFMLIPRVH